MIFFGSTGSILACVHVMLPGCSRRKHTWVHGDISNEKVRVANNEVYLLSPLYRFAANQGIIVFLEQPFQSWMSEFPCMKDALTATQSQKVRTFLGAFSEDLGIPKPLQIWSNACFVNHLTRSAPMKNRAGYSPYYTKDSTGAYTGVKGPQGLESSGAYPKAFGDFIIQIYLRYGSRQILRPPEARLWLNHFKCVF